MSCECKCKFYGRKCSSNQKCKNLKEHHMCKIDYIWIPATCSCENNKYLRSMIDDSMIKFDELIETTKTAPTNLNEEK